MRQGEVGPQGSWVGNPLGGVKAPEPLILPDPATRFGKTKDRLDALAEGHPMADWLRFLARLSGAQGEAAAKLGAVPALDLAFVRQAVEARMPPLAADGHRRHPVWRHGLTLMLDSLEAGDEPAAARQAMTELRARRPEAIESLADAFLQGAVQAADAGAALYVAAALQVYFTRLAHDLPASELRLLPERSLCPCCGSPPVAGVVMASGATPGARYLYCSLCGTAWNHVRAICVTCGDSRSLSLKSIEGGDGAVKVETCNACHTYVKSLYQAKDTKVDPFADDLASLGLDIMVGEAGWARHAPNPFLLAG